MGEMLYLECAAGVSGDMAVAALLDVGSPAEKEERRKLVLDVLGSLGVDGFEVRISRVSKSGLDACDFNVVLDEACDNHDHDMAYLHGHASFAAGHGAGGEGGGHRGHRHGPCEHGGHLHEHRNLADVLAIIEASGASKRAKELAVRIFGIIAEAEAQAHGKPVDQVHFHEVGALDSIADVLAFAVCFDHLGLDEVVVTDLAEGRGTVRCQHGVIPVPVPAVVNIARAYGIPLRILDVEGELVTPTGCAFAAAVRTHVRLPERFVVKSVGVGAGKRAYDTPGVVRAMVIEPA